ncbi:MAG TPA: hypothetical protein VI911_11870 [Patescibacteria group bacterium]|nr:hypothetical protein [Patescibacteria group bacterium]
MNKFDKLFFLFFLTIFVVAIIQFLKLDYQNALEGIKWFAGAR